MEDSPTPATRRLSIRGPEALDTAPVPAAPAAGLQRVRSVVGRPPLAPGTGEASGRRSRHSSLRRSKTIHSGRVNSWAAPMIPPPSPTPPPPENATAAADDEDMVDGFADEERANRMRSASQLEVLRDPSHDCNRITPSTVRDGGNVALSLAGHGALTQRLQCKNLHFGRVGSWPSSSRPSRRVRKRTLS